MPRLRSGRVPAYRRHKATGQAVVTLDGTDFYLGVFGSPPSHAEYNRLVGEWLANGRRLSDPGQPVADRTVNEVAAEYLTFAEGYYVKDGAPSDTVYGIRRAMTYLCETYGDTPAQNFGPLSLIALQQRMITEKKSRRYINDTVDRVRRIFKFAASRELLPAAVYHALQTVPGLRKGRTDARDPPPVRPVSDQVVETTLPYLLPVVAAMVQVQRLTGCRPDEVCQMRPCDIDRTTDVWEYRPPRFKTQHIGGDRVIFIGPRAQGVLRPFLFRSPEAYCFSPAQAVAAHNEDRRANRKSPMTPSQAARSRRKNPRRSAQDRYSVDTYRRAIHRACDAVDTAAREAAPKDTSNERLFARWSPNRLRHTAGTEIRRRFGAEASQVVLGHSALNTTEIYAERDLARAAAVIREIG
jgi:integrase